MKTRKQWIPRWWEVLLVAIVVIGIHFWQTKHSLSANGDQIIPSFTLPNFSGMSVSTHEMTGKPTLYYFFAPWCSVCELSIENTQYLKTRLDEGKINIVTIALDYTSYEEVEAFLADKDIPGTILLGTRQQIKDFKIKGYPTYYIADNGGRIRWVSVGYSTAVGLRTKMEWLL